MQKSVRIIRRSVLAGLVWLAVDARAATKGQVHYLFGNIRNSLPSHHGDLHSGLLRWLARGYQPRAVFGATRADLKRALKSTRSEFIFWIGHGCPDFTEDWDAKQVVAADFETIGPKLRGVMIHSCQQNAFYKRIRAHLKRAQRPTPSLWSLGSTTVVRRLDFSETRALFADHLIAKIEAESFRLEPVSCEENLETRGE